MMRQPEDWPTPDIRSVSNGLANAQDISFEFQKYTISPDFPTLIRTVRPNNDFGLTAFMPFSTALRAPPETLMMRRVSDTDQLCQFEPQKRNLLVGTRISRGKPLLLAKFACGEWGPISRGCILRMPFLSRKHQIHRDYFARYICPGHGRYGTLQQTDGAAHP